ncbi:serine/threonine-protein kinase [Mesorhizobium sp. ES1-3]|uniref:serine/threonine-protein kinase n=1 Tax=Mesorhizobium sp. ES1-3 TaxID=2876628 RepID=UPI001CCB2253|nr:serine/threonine-protein kinase [Mesorhizobium sp. ES1-3]MBZ9673953.1 serine/threonine protein kinase [Mesorhizobium sp. ES1-3]
MSGMLHKPGDTIADRYLVSVYVGEGGMQEVYSAQDTLLGKYVALKGPKNASASKRFHRSAIVSARVNHANVAKTLDYIEENGRSYLIEELIDGCDLRVMLTKYVPKFDPYIVSRILHHLAKGIAASHHAGVIHRDLKPSNVMAVGGPALNGLKITDFGIAKMAEKELEEAVEGGEGSLTASATAIGALPYMAPEMIESMKAAGKPADIWSLSAMMFELLTGERPFGAGLKAIPKILACDIRAIPPQLTGHPQFKSAASELLTILNACLVLDPGKRLTADAVVTACEELCYSVGPREFGTVSYFDNGYWGFIQPPKGDNVFFHRNSIYGGDKVKLGDRYWYAKHQGGQADRAFPLVKAR